MSFTDLLFKISPDANEGYLPSPSAGKTAYPPPIFTKTKAPFHCYGGCSKFCVS